MIRQGVKKLLKTWNAKQSSFETQQVLETVIDNRKIIKYFFLSNFHHGHYASIVVFVADKGKRYFKVF